MEWGARTDRKPSRWSADGLTIALSLGILTPRANAYRTQGIHEPCNYPIWLADAAATPGMSNAPHPARRPSCAPPPTPNPPRHKAHNTVAPSPLISWVQSLPPTLPARPPPSRPRPHARPRSPRARPSAAQASPDPTAGWALAHEPLSPPAFPFPPGVSSKTFHTSTPPSSPTETSCRPSGANLRLRTAPEWPTPSHSSAASLKR